MKLIGPSQKLKKVLPKYCVANTDGLKAPKAPKLEEHIPEVLAFENDILCFRYVILGFVTNDKITDIAMARIRHGEMVDRWAFSVAKQIYFPTK